MTCSARVGSSAESGSSTSHRLAGDTRARARATRWRCPPERMLGQSCARSARPTSSSAACASGRRSLESPSETLSSTRRQGSRRASWNIRRTSGLPGRGSCRSSSTEPAVGSSSPASRRSSVLLPQPLCPTMATNSPLPKVRSTPRSTGRAPKDLWRLFASISTPLGMGILVTFSCHLASWARQLPSPQPRSRASGAGLRLFGADARLGVTDRVSRWRHAVRLAAPAHRLRGWGRGPTGAESAVGRRRQCNRRRCQARA